MDLSEAKNKIIEKFLENVIFEGADFKTLEDSCTAAGYDAAMAKILFTNYKAEITEYLLNSALEKAFSSKEPNFKGLKVREKISTLVFSFIKNLNPYKKQLTILVKTIDPETIIRNVVMNYNISSEIWYECGDNSTDFNYYSKRILLSCICFSSLIYWLSKGSNLCKDLDDRSEEIEIKTFIDWQIEKVMKLGKIKSIKSELPHKIISKIPFLRLIKFKKYQD
jgi:ubiquinone biosynthesis protein COQ9